VTTTRRRALARAGRAALAAFAALVVVLAAAPARAQMPLPEATDFANATDVGDEPEAARLAFYRAEEHLAAGRAREAGGEVMKLLRSPTRGRVRWGERLVVPVETAALLFLSRLPQDVRAELAKEDAAVAGAPPRGGDPAALRLFAARHPLLPSGERALLDAGVRELLAGRFATAASDLARLVHWPSVAPGAAKTLAAARLLEAESRLRDGVVEGPLAGWPEGTVASAEGGTTPFADLLARARGSAAPRFEFGDAPPRFERLFKPAPTHVATLDPENALHRSRFKLVQQQPPSDEPDLKDLPTRAPIAAGGRLITLEPLDAGEGGPVALHVRDLATGADLFAPLRSDFDWHLDPDQFEVVLDRAALALDGDALYVTLELREPGQSAREMVNAGESASGALLKLDLAREGFVEWRVTSADLELLPEFRGHVASGAPIACDGRVVVAASRLVVKETECSLLAFDAATGAPLGAAFLARATAIPRYGTRFGNDELRRVNPSPAVVRDGVAYVCTNLGVIAAVRVCDLEAEWLFRYHRAVLHDSDHYERAALSDLGPWLGRPPLVLPDRVIASPADSHYLYELARWTSPAGWLLLHEPIEKLTRLCLLGADATRCWFLQRAADERGLPLYSVQATDPDGAELWSAPLPVMHGNLITGAAALTDRWLFLPTDRHVYRIELATGLVTSLPPPKEAGVPYPEFGTFGDLAIAGDRLVSVSPQFTMLFR